MTPDPETQVLHRPLPGKGIFFVHRGGKRIAELTYSLSADTVIADHTFVDPGFRGTAIAPSLVEALVGWARKEGKQVVPMCSYVREVFDRTPQYADVRKAA